MFTGGSARIVEQTWLDEKNERAISRLAVSHRRLRLRDFFERSAEMNGRRARAFLRFPWDGSIQRVVKLEYAGAMAETRKAQLVTARQVAVSDFDQIFRREIAKKKTVAV